MTRLRWLRQLVCRHDFRLERELDILVEVACDRCGGHWCWNRTEGGMVAWNDRFETFFVRKLKRRQRTAAQEPV